MSAPTWIGYSAFGPNVAQTSLNIVSCVGNGTEITFEVANGGSAFLANQVVVVADVNDPSFDGKAFVKSSTETSIVVLSSLVGTSDGGTIQLDTASLLTAKGNAVGYAGSDWVVAGQNTDGVSKNIYSSQDGVEWNSASGIPDTPSITLPIVSAQVVGSTITFTLSLSDSLRLSNYRQIIQVSGFTNKPAFNGLYRVDGYTGNIVCSRYSSINQGTPIAGDTDTGGIITTTIIPGACNAVATNGTYWMVGGKNNDGSSNCVYVSNGANGPWSALSGFGPGAVVRSIATDGTNWVVAGVNYYTGQPGAYLYGTTTSLNPGASWGTPGYTNAVAYGGGYWVMVGNSSSGEGIQWGATPTLGSKQLAFSNDTIVTTVNSLQNKNGGQVVAYDGTANFVASGPASTGITIYWVNKNNLANVNPWTGVSLTSVGGGANFFPKAIAYGNSKWVVGGSGTSTNNIFSATAGDLGTWSGARIFGTGGIVNSVVYDTKRSMWLAFGQTSTPGTTTVYYSTNATTWAIGNQAFNGSANAVARNLSGDLVLAGQDSTGLNFYTAVVPPCFKEDTKILTDKGYVVVQNLRKGDMVKTVSHGLVPIHAIGVRPFEHLCRKERIKEQLYVCSQKNYPQLFEDLVITGCHSVLVPEFESPQQRAETEESMDGIYITDNHYRLPACVDRRAEVYPVSGKFNVYHIALENSDYYMNYGVYANGLLVESTSKRYLLELSGMTLLN